jgi:F0F1-type ATP synthase membrane subunit c/vacuolar-type H+-ATPase subunit K
VILCSGVSVPYGQDTGISLTISGFSSVYGQWISIPLCLSICCFAIATILGWGLYGTRCAEYLLGDQAWKPFAVLQILTVFAGAPLTQTIYGFLLMQQMKGSDADPAFLIGLGIASGLAMAFSAVFQGKAGAAGADALAETGKGFSQYITVVGLCETVALFALVFSMVALG